MTASAAATPTVDDLDERRDRLVTQATIAFVMLLAGVLAVGLLWYGFRDLDPHHGVTVALCGGYFVFVGAVMALLWLAADWGDLYRRQGRTRWAPVNTYSTPKVVAVATLAAAAGTAVMWVAIVVRPIDPQWITVAAIIPVDTALSLAAVAAAHRWARRDNPGRWTR